MNALNPRPVRVLYVQPAPLFGGAERQAANLASQLPDFGLEVLPLVGPGKAIVKWLEDRGVERIAFSTSFPGGFKKQRGLARLSLPFRYLWCGIRACREIAALLDAEGSDVIVASLPFAWITSSLVARKTGTPVVWRAGGARINWVQKAALASLTHFLRPSLLLCNGEAVKRTFEPLVRTKVEVIRNGVDRRVFTPRKGDPTRYRPPHARFVVGYAGRLTDAKRPQDVIALAVRLKTTFPEAEFLIGGEGSRRPIYEQIARDAGATNVRFLGFVSDMPSFYAACDAVVLTSGAEGCPNFLLEAMAMGKPIVAADVEPVLEVLDHGQNALIYPLGNVEALTNAVSSLLSSPELRSALSRAAQKHVEDFTLEATARRLAAVLRELVAESIATRDLEPRETRQTHATLRTQERATPAAPARGRLSSRTRDPDLQRTH